MSFDFAPYGLDRVIADAARQAFGAAVAENPEHTFFAFALTTLSDVQYIECSLNSDRNFADILPAALPYSRKVSEDQQKLYYKWWPNEWARFEYFAQEDRDFFAPVKALLHRIETDAETALNWEESFDVRRGYVFDMMIAALAALDALGCFGAGAVRHERLIFADVYDDPESDALRTRSVRALNTGKASDDLINEFLGLVH